MSEKFQTKRGKGAVCYRIPRKEKGGRTTYTSDYYRRITRGGKQYYFRVGRDRRTAEAVSNQIDDFLRDPRNSVEDAVRKFNPDSVARDRQHVTVADVVRQHERVEKVLELGAKSARNYRLRLMWLVRRVMAYRKGRSLPERVSYGEAVEDVGGFPVIGLNQKFVADLKMAVLRDAGASLKDQNNAKRHLKSVISDARSVFSEGALQEYRAAGLAIPDIAGFMKGRVFQRVAKQRYMLPRTDVILRIFRDMDELRFRPNAFRMFLLAAGAGLRRAEMLNARQEWLVGGDHPRIDLDVTDQWQQKHGGTQPVEFCPWAFAELSRVLPAGCDRILEGGAGEIERDSKWLCDWLRNKGLDRLRPIHEVRMLFGCWVANRRGLYVAQKLLRHTSAQVTSDHYADFVPDNKVLACWDGILGPTGS